MDDEDAPEKASKKINAFGGPIKASNKIRNGPGSTHMPDFAKMVSVGKSGRNQDTLNNPYDSDFLSNPLAEDEHRPKKPRLTNDLERMLIVMGNKISINRPSLLSEQQIDDKENGDDQNGEA